MKREDLELLSAIRQLTGVQIRLGEHDEIKSHQTIEGTTIMVAVTTYDVTETSREIRFKRCGWKIYTLKRVGDSGIRPTGQWRTVEVTDVFWDDQFVPYVFEKFSKYETLQEQADRRDWERMCHRPGSARTPMDNLDRQFQGYDYGPKTHTSEGA